MAANTTSSTNRKTNKGDLPFYVAPTGITTSSQIIKEAKEKLNDIPKTKQSLIPVASGNNATQHNSIRTLQTNRPFTPRDDDKRSLYGKSSIRPLNERLPSSFSLSSKSFDIIDPSRPQSGTRLSPLEKLSNNKVNEYPKIDSVEIEMSKTHQLPPNPVLNLKRTNSKTRLLPQLNQTPTTTNRTNSFEEDVNSYKSESMVFTENSLSSFDLNKKINEEKDGQKSTNNAEEENYWDNVLKPHLNQMSILYQEKDVNNFYDRTDELYDLLKAKNMLGRASVKRTNILKIVFKFLDSENEKLKLKLARIILALDASLCNLTTICRLLFTLSRNEENDAIFLENNLFELMLNSADRLDFKSNSDSIVYFCGALKNLSGDSKILKELSNLNILKILSNIMKNLSQFYKENETNLMKRSEAGHVLVQLTAVLRNLADLSQNREKFISCQIIEELTNALKYYTSDSDLMMNISRILSKLTLHIDCCTVLSECTPCYKAFIKVMIKHEKKHDLIVRIGFILGNLFSRNDAARIRYLKESHSIDTIIHLISLYLSLNQQQMSSVNEENKKENEQSESEDVIIKLIRVIANLTINDEVGMEIARRKDCLDILMKILELKDISNEELVINTIVTLNNLTFYDTDLFEKQSIDLINVLMKYVLSNNYDAILEVFRVIANLSRQKNIRNYLVSRKIDLMAITLLDSGNHELVYIVIGVLINLMSDEDKRTILKKEDGIMKLIEVLSDFSYIDWQLAAMVCKVLMNYSEKIYSSNDCFGEKQANLLKNILYEFLDENFVMDLMKSKPATSNQENSNLHDEYMLNIWFEEFCPVAQRLLERIESHQSQLEPL